MWSEKYDKLEDDNPAIKRLGGGTQKRGTGMGTRGFALDGTGQETSSLEKQPEESCHHCAGLLRVVKETQEPLRSTWYLPQLSPLFVKAPHVLVYIKL